MYASNDSNYKTIVFILGVDLPVGINGHEIVASKYDKVLYTIGNRYYYNNKDKDIFKFAWTNSITNCSWTKVPTQLQYGRHSTVAMTIPDTLANKLRMQLKQQKMFEFICP